jgi:hypothetical protein
MRFREEIISKLEEIKGVPTPREFAKVYRAAQFEQAERVLRSQKDKGDYSYWLLWMQCYGAEGVRDYDNACEAGRISERVQGLLDSVLGDIYYSFSRTANKRNSGEKSSEKQGENGAFPLEKNDEFLSL